MKNSNSLKWIYKNTKKYIPAVLLVALVSAIISVGYIALAYSASMVIDIASGEIEGDVWINIILLAVLILGQIVLYVLNSNIKIRVIGKTEIYLKNKMFESLIKKEYSNLYTIHSGDILNRFTSDIDVVVGGVTGIIPSAVSLVSRLIAAFWLLIKFSPKLALGILVLGVFVGVGARIYSVFFKRLHKKVQEAQGKTRSYMQECTENVVVVKSFGALSTLSKKLESLMRQTYILKLKRNLLSNISNVSVYMIFTGGYYAVLAWGAFLVASDGISFGMLTALLSIIAQIKGPITSVSGLIPQYFSMLASAERIMELENLPDEPEAYPKEKISEIYRDMKAIKLEGVEFSYVTDTKKVLKDCDMTINRGEITALVGGSGEGKSTIFRLLLGLWRDFEGEIYIESEEKIDLTPSHRGLFAYVPQGNLILSGTIAENIRFCKEDATEEEVINAAKCADIYDFIMSLPDSFDTMLGERGLGLSEGQLQRISIARAILSGAPILLLDECTSALDEKTEQTVLHNIKELGSTALIISHRAAALEICDRIYSLENGELSLKKEVNLSKRRF